MKHYPQIVKILDTSRLVDCEGREQAFRTAPGHRLGLGYQVVSWPDDVEAPAYDEQARFVGPFRTYGHARLALERLVDLDFPYRKSA